MIFSRGRGSGGRHKKGEDADREAHRSPGAHRSDDADELVEQAAAGRPSGPGPYDITEAPSGVERHDLGSLQLPIVDGVEVRVQAGPDGSIGQLVLVNGQSALQLAVFAAPRSAGIWDEFRADLRDSLSNEGTKPEEAGGEYGTELRARVGTPSELRFIGVDGPRWMVLAVYQGAAAADPAAAGPLADCLRELVVDRGREAMPVREALPLRLPREMAEQVRVQAQTVAPQQAAEEARAELRRSQGSPESPDGSGAGQAAQQQVNGSAPQGGRRGSSPRSRRSR